MPSDNYVHAENKWSASGDARLLATCLALSALIVVADLAPGTAASAQWLTGLAGVLAVLLVGGLVAVARRRDAQRVRALRDAVLAFGEGRPHPPIAVESSDAIGELASALKQMEQDTERHIQEIQNLRQAQKAEAIGRLAGGVAHEFNNMLTIILGYTAALLDEAPEGTPTRPMLQDVKRAAERSATLTRQLLAFSRQQTVDTVVLDASAVVSETLRTSNRVLGETIELVSDSVRGPCNVRLPAGQLEQVLGNLVANARDAMPAGGKLDVRMRRVTLPADGPLPSGLAAGPYYEIAVRDDGAGMDARTRELIFDPFFTTKKQGTGLGLSTALGIVAQGGGTIEVETELGRGSCFTVFLPEAKPAPDSTGAIEALSSGSLAAQSTILLVEDEDAIRRLVERVLRRKGYTVLAACNGAAALAVAEQYQGRINLLLTDVVMPIMGGRQLAERLVEQRPSLKVMFMSGYTDDATLAEAGPAALLQKPITPDVLTKKVKSVLLKARSAPPGPH